MTMKRPRRPFKRPVEPGMTRAQIGECIDDRFGRWGKFLRAQDATPTVVVGIGHPGPLRDGFELMITCPEETSQADVVQALEAALAILRRGKAHFV